MSPRKKVSYKRSKRPGNEGHKQIIGKHVMGKKNTHLRSKAYGPNAPAETQEVYEAGYKAGYREARSRDRAALLDAEKKRIEAALDEVLHHAQNLTAEIRGAREELEARLDAQPVA